ncbi:MAG: O-antigen ligase family protein [Bacteroidales bacterium]
MVLNACAKKFSFEKGLFYVILFSLFMLPPFRLFPDYFLFRLEDVLFPLALLVVLDNKKNNVNPYSALLGAISIYVLFTILINHPYSTYRDFFEIYKVFKYIVFFLFFYHMIRKYEFKEYLRYLFYVVLAFNCFHYFNILGFNDIIEPFYVPDERLMFFGKNSAGDPATKRMMGTMSNPNNNGILFLFFAAIFAPSKQTFRKYDVVYFLSFLGLLLTQSRTGMVAFVVLTLLNIILNRLTYRKIFAQLICFVVIFIGINMVEFADIRLQKELSPGDKKALTKKSSEMDREDYIPASQYLTNVVEDDISERFFSGRIETWKMLWDMVLDKPVFGHGPWKEYYYGHKIYSENEYILILWRYGFAGLVLYLLMIVFPLIYYFNRMDIRRSAPYVLFVAVILITALMNNPINDQRILLMFAFMNGLFFTDVLSLNDHEKTAPDRE